MIIQKFKLQQLDDVKDVLQQAFLNHPHSEQNEHLIVENLITNNNDVLSMVGIDNDKVVAFITYSKVKFDNDNDNWVGLAPVAVLPECQGCGLGSKIIESSLEQIKQSYDGCVVMGEGEYYKRFGFDVIEGLFFEGVPAEYFMAQSFKDTKPQGAVVYNQAFYLK